MRRSLGFTTGKNIPFETGLQGSYACIPEKGKIGKKSCGKVTEKSSNFFILLDF